MPTSSPESSLSIWFEPFAASASAWRVWEGGSILGKGFQAEYATSIAGKRYASIRRSQLEQLIRAVATAAREGPVLIRNTGRDVPFSDHHGFVVDVSRAGRQAC